MKLTEQLEVFLATPRESRDWNAGALLLLQLTNNPILYRNISLNPKGKADFIEGKLQQFLKSRKALETHKEIEDKQQQVNEIIESRTEFKENNPAADFKAGKRADHDLLPETIQSLYVENLDIVHRMRELHLKLRLLSDTTKQIPDSKRKPLLDEFISLDKKLHDNWNTYDHFVIKAETAEQTTVEQAEPQQEEAATEPKPKPEAKNKSSKKSAKA